MQNQMNKMQVKIDNNHKEVMGRLDKVETRLDKVEEKLDKVEVRLDKVEKRLNVLEQNQDSINEFIFQSENAFRKTEEVYRVFQSVKNIMVSEEE